MMRKKNLLVLLIALLVCVGGVYGVSALLRDGLDDRDDGTSGKSVEDMLSSDMALKPISLNGKTYIPKKNVSSYLLMGIDHEGEVTEHSSYFGGQADTLLLVVVDREQKEYSLLQINRDTMCMVDFVGSDGTPIGERKQMQIALAYALGSGLEDSCENTVRAVSTLLYGVPISGYAALNMDAMPILNDAVGGVTVTIEDDFSESDSSLVLGETITLDGQQAYNYLRGRMAVGDGENTSRMRRQRTYMTAFLKKAQRQLAADKSLATSLYTELEPYMVTDLSGKDVSTLLETSQYYSYQGITTPEGTIGTDGTFVTFQPDEEALRQLVLDMFYTTEN